MRRLLITLPLLLSYGCLAPKQATTDEDTSSTQSGSGLTVSDVQQGIENGSVLDGDEVVLSRVVVTTGFTTEGEGFFVQDPGGGEWSGIYVYTALMSGEFNPLVGDALEITGSVVEFYGYTEITVSSSEYIRVVGEEEVIATPVSNVSDWEAYEGGLISLADQTVVSGINNYGEAGLSAGIQMDNLFFDFDSEYGAQYDSVTGVVSYSFEEFKINPRSADDLAGYVEGSGGDVMTIVDIQQNGHVGPAKLEGVIVTSPVADEGFWVQDIGGGEWSGIYVYTVNADGELPQVAVGDVLNLTGEVSEYYDLTELTVGDASDIELTGESLPSDVVVTALSGAPTDWENYEGVLVSLADLEITDASLDYGQCATNYAGLLLDDVFFSYSLSNGDMFESVVGIVHYSYGEFKLLPRSEEDLGGQSTNPGDPDPEPQSSTIAEAQQTGFSGAISLQGVIATTADTGNGFWIQDPNGGEWSGVYVYTGAMTNSNLGVAIGDEISLTGEMKEFYDLTEIEMSDGDAFTITSNGNDVVSTTLTSVPADWENYEGVLVTLSDLSVSSDANEYGQCTTNYSIFTDDVIYDSMVGNGNSFSLFTGIVHYSYGEFKILPRMESDLIE